MPEDKNAAHCPAIITRVWNSTIVNLTVIPDGKAPFFYTSSNQDEGATKPSSWHWPEPSPESSSESVYVITRIRYKSELCALHKVY